jgi:hypothetical protein
LAAMFSGGIGCADSPHPAFLWRGNLRYRRTGNGQLFLCGGGLLFTTNYLRFGSGWEFGHRLNASPALPSIYSTRFDYPFKHVPLLEAARELFGMLFLTNHFNGVDWYAQGIFPWQSHTIRKHGIDMTTYDLSYAVLLAMA